MRNKPIYILTVDSLAGPGHRWMKILCFIKKYRNFEFRLITSKKFIEDVIKLDNNESKCFVDHVMKHAIIYDKYDYNIFNFITYVIKCFVLRLQGFSILHSIMSLSFSLRLKRILGFKVIYEVVGPVFADKISEAQFNNVELFICVSPTIKKQLNDKFGNTDKIKVYPIPFFHISNQELKYEKKENIVVFAHNYMVSRKNYVLCAFLFRDIAKKKPEWVFYFLGKGRRDDGYTKAYLEYILKGRCNIIFDYMDDISSILKRSKISLSLNKINNYPSQTIMESLYYGNALLLTDVGNSNEFINNNGYLVKSEYEEIREKLLEIIDDKELLNKCWQSKKYIETKFKPSIYIDYLIKLYCNTNIH